MSETLQLGDEVKLDYKEYSDLAEPFVKALNFSYDAFYGMFMNANYVGNVLAKYNLKGMPTHEIKWATEGIFEYIRRKEFPEKCKKLYTEDLENATPEEKEKIKLFEMEVSGNILECDMTLFDEALDLVWDLEDPDQLEEIFEIARRYFRGEKGDEPVMEIISDGIAVAKRDITELLKG